MGLGHSPSIIPDGLVFYFDPIKIKSFFPPFNSSLIGLL